MDISSFAATRLPLIEARLQELVPETDAAYGALFSAARYSLFSPAKRLRPLLAMATTASLGGDEAKALSPACALELIHTYSLIHDDLPCMDNDDYRRGRLTLHKVTSEGHALLTGDFLLTHAFQVLASLEDFSAEQKVKLVAVLATRAGGKGMIAGQVLDVAGSNKSLGISELRDIYLAKTAALLTAAVEFGGIVAGATPLQMSLLEKLGQSLGLAFQIVDDVLDVIASQQKHGKEVPSDVTNQKSTYASLLGPEQARQTALELLGEARISLHDLHLESSPLAAIAERLVLRDR